MLKNDERRNVRFRIRRMIAGNGMPVCVDHAENRNQSEPMTDIGDRPLRKSLTAAEFRSLRQGPGGRGAPRTGHLPRDEGHLKWIACTC